MTDGEVAGASGLASDGRLGATYRLICEPDESPEARAKAIAFEQTVELPPECVSADLVSEVVGEVEELEALGEGVWLATISYSAALAGGNFSQLMNLLYGNISLMAGIRLQSVNWPENVLAACQGPRFGLQGLRALCSAQERRPLTCGVAKPLGLSSQELARRVGQMALAGIDIIKDDHSLEDQATAPFRERVRLCQRALEEANASTGGSTVYFPCLGGSGRDLYERVTYVLGQGCRGVVILPFYLGLDTVAGLAADSGLALLAHPSGSGVLFGPEHGIAPEVYLGQMLRIAGCDAVIYPHVGSRFPMNESTAEAISRNLVSGLGSLRSSAPAPGGNIEPSELGEWLGLYGHDSILVAGASVYCADRAGEAARDLVSIVRGAVS